jgi:hypothetical protein
MAWLSSVTVCCTLGPSGNGDVGFFLPAAAARVWLSDLGLFGGNDGDSQTECPSLGRLWEERGFGIRQMQG